ncbi:Aluminum-activated malate transporter 8 [Vitis vinifera]|uniref:Aluminum-activated malate transporter 8 n=1 Tax=Vitis vinifera TaxID=29760 RepID=A0A438IBW6_VITVI|nr:Aluminum-activated malate transporter 8 [Vitis vinifera]
MNIQGYTIGNLIIDHFSDFNSRIAYAHQVGLLSDELYEVIIPPTTWVDGGFGKDVLEFLLKGMWLLIEPWLQECYPQPSSLFVSIGIYPMWAGDDLYKLVASNVEKLGNFLKGFSGEYFRVSGDGESKDSKTILQGYKNYIKLHLFTFLNLQTNFARWEPGHGRFRFRHP